MAIVVQKFGGTSVADAVRVKRAAQKIIRAKAAGYQVVATVSARAGMTDELIALASVSESDHPRPRSARVGHAGVHR